MLLHDDVITQAIAPVCMSFYFSVCFLVFYFTLLSLPLNPLLGLDEVIQFLVVRACYDLISNLILLALSHLLR